jgi:hypothetical protein
LEGLAKDVGTFYGHLLYFTSILYIFHDHLELVCMYFSVLECFNKKNLATLFEIEDLRLGRDKGLSALPPSPPHTHLSLSYGSVPNEVIHFEAG